MLRAALPSGGGGSRSFSDAGALLLAVEMSIGITASRLTGSPPALDLAPSIQDMRKHRAEWISEILASRRAREATAGRRLREVGIYIDCRVWNFREVNAFSSILHACVAFAGICHEPLPGMLSRVFGRGSRSSRGLAACDCASQWFHSRRVVAASFAGRVLPPHRRNPSAPPCFEHPTRRCNGAHLHASHSLSRLSLLAVPTMTTKAVEFPPRCSHPR